VSTPSRPSDLPAPEVAVASDRTGTFSYAVALSVGFGIIGGLIVGGSTGHTSGLNNWTWVVIGTAVLGAAGAAFAYKPYGWVGAALYGVAGATVGLLATLLKQPVHSVGDGIAFGVAFGGGIGMTTIASRSWGSFTVCRLILAMRGDLPWSLMAFLKERAPAQRAASGRRGLQVQASRAAEPVGKRAESTGRAEAHDPWLPVASAVSVSRSDIGPLTELVSGAAGGRRS
jgi:hypothetical protein